MVSLFAALVGTYMARRPWIAWFMTVRIALASVAEHPLRTVLSTLAVAMGVAGIVAVHSVIAGLDHAFDSSMDLGKRGKVIVQRRPARGGDPRVDWERAPAVDEGDLAALNAHVTRARAIVPVAHELLDSTSRVGVLVHGDPIEGELDVYGVPPSWMLLGRGVAEGRFFSQAESDAGRSVAVVGTDLFDRMRERHQGLGDAILFDGRPFEVVGVLERRGKNPWGNSYDAVVVVPPPVFAETFGTRSLQIALVARTDADAEVDALIGETVSIVRGARRLAPTDPSNFAIDAGEEARDLYQKLTGGLKLATVVLAVLTLLVSGGGILNIMLFSIGERTREIGVRGALGVRPRLILAQFLVEGMAISGAGGAVGLLFGAGVARLIAAASPLPARVTPAGLAIGLIFGVTVGIVFSFLPARRASRLAPAVAMRA